MMEPKDKTIKYFDLNNYPLEERLDKLPNIARGIILDVETTGLNKDTDAIIELGMIEFQYDTQDNTLLGITAIHNWLNDPGTPISPEITEITGITNADVANQSLPYDTIQELFKDTPLVIAHNAKFDRGFVRAQFSITDECIWACSMQDINWRKYKHGCRTLQHLCNDLGFWFDGHRASIDALATYKLLSETNTFTNKPYFDELVTAANSQYCYLAAYGAPFSIKDTLKEMGYSWNVSKKVWEKVVLEEEFFIEQNKLGEIWSGSRDIKRVRLPKTNRFLE